MLQPTPVTSVIIVVRLCFLGLCMSSMTIFGTT